MAGVLKLKHELIAIKVCLRQEKRGTLIRVELETNDGGIPRTVGKWDMSIESLGLTAQLPKTGPAPFALPGFLLDELVTELNGLNLPHGHPIWLHLVKPYGFLGALGWESALVPAVQRPVLRLPDFLEKPRENRASLDVAICSSAPVSDPIIHTASLVRDVISEILQASTRPRTNIHVFCDLKFYDEVRDAFIDEPRVSVHDPHEALSYGQQERVSKPSDGGTIQSPWLRWMRDAMRGRSLDVVHFICHGYLGYQRPAISLAESPMVNLDWEHARYIGVPEVATFLTQTGAWSAAFAHLPENYSEAGLRLFADTLAQTRPGPVLLHVLRQANHSTVADAYRFLFRDRPSQPPTNADMFAYCQPELAETQAPMQKEKSPAALDANSRIFAGQYYKTREAPEPSADAVDDSPNWLSAAQRYVEEISLDIQRRRGSNGAGLMSSARHVDVASQTLDAIQGVIAKHTQSIGKEIA